MMKTARALFASLLVLSAGASISGCQSDPDIDITKLGLETDPPDVLYTQGLANMKAGNMAPKLATHLAPGGSVILSGILAGQRWKVIAAYSGAKLRHV